MIPALTPRAYTASVLQAFYVAIYEIGCLAGAVFALMFGDRLGRRKMMFTGAIILIIGVVIQITAFSGHWAGGQFIIGRISKSARLSSDFCAQPDSSPAQSLVSALDSRRLRSRHGTPSVPRLTRVVLPSSSRFVPFSSLRTNLS